MYTQLSSAWTFDVESAANWSFIRLRGPDNGDAEGTPLAEMIWQSLDCHPSRRVVLDMSEIKILRSVVVGQLVNLHKRICLQGGTLRVAGLSDDNYRVLVACRLHERFPRYASTDDAIMDDRAQRN